MEDGEGRRVLAELEPRAAQLLGRHLSLAKEWMPHELIPWSRGRDFDHEPWSPDQPTIGEAARLAFEVNLLTEDNLPSYHRLIASAFGKGAGTWETWVHRWTAEEARHAIVLRDYLVVTRNADPVALERARMQHVSNGYDHPTDDVLRCFVYVALQELATRLSHANTGKSACDPVAERIAVRVAQDENLHMVFYRDLIATAAELWPSRVVEAVAAEVMTFAMPGASMPDFTRKAVRIAAAGIYDLRLHRDEVLVPLLAHWRIFELSNLDAGAEQARERLAAFLARLDTAATRFSERLVSSARR